MSGCFMFKFPIKIHQLLSVVVLCFFLVGCGGGSGEQDSAVDNTVIDNSGSTQDTLAENTGNISDDISDNNIEETIDRNPVETTEILLVPDSPSAPVPALPVGECTVSDNDSDANETELLPLLTTLSQHLDGATTLSEEQLDEIAASIEVNGNELTDSTTLINLAFSTIELYDEVYGPLFLNDSTLQSISRNSANAGDAIHYAIIALQQSVVDHAYANQNVRRYRSTFENRSFSTAEFFPGAVSGNTTDTGIYSVEIDASNNPSLSHRPYGAFQSDSRRPTGAYAPPGAIVEVNVPASMVGNGYKVRVGAHSWDLSNKNSITRLDRISMVYDINCSNTLVSNPLGGGIYIEVPFEADVGIADVQIENAVRSPFYSARDFTDHTSDIEWEIEKTHAAPWADLESEHFMIQVPTQWLDEVTDPALLMAEWDEAMQSILDLYGITETYKTMLYVQIDRVFRGSANFPGYPMSNFQYNPLNPNAGNSAQSFLRGPDEVGYVTFHELGHQLFFTKFRGEIESVVHLPYVNFMNKVFGIDLDTAFSHSSFRNPDVNLDQAFINWAVRPNFQQGLPMRIARPNSEKLYQRRGYAHYIVIAKLFGWEALERFWESEHVDFANGIDYDRNSDGEGDVDSRILRMSRAARVDLRPLIHLWGNHPENPDDLSLAIQTENLPASTEIYDELIRYKTLIPVTNEDFEAHARTMYPLLRQDPNTEAFEGWYFEKALTWSEDDSVASQRALQDIIDLYFPEGRPVRDIILVNNPLVNGTQQSATEVAPLSLEYTNDVIQVDHHAVP